MRVRFFGTLREFATAKELPVAVAAGETVRVMLARLTAEHPTLEEKIWGDDGELRNSVHVLVNGRSIRYLRGLDTILQEDDQVALFPAVGGG
jgi:molybdopterin synthase sulfur carrier subunit